jgi:hypothetical protein
MYELPKTIPEMKSGSDPVAKGIGSSVGDGSGKLVNVVQGRLKKPFRVPPRI